MGTLNHVRADQQWNFSLIAQQVLLLQIGHKVADEFVPFNAAWKMGAVKVRPSTKKHAIKWSFPTIIHNAY